MFDARTTLSADVSAEVHRHLGAHVFDVVVPRSVRLAEAPSYGRPIPCTAPAHAERRRTESWPPSCIARDSVALGALAETADGSSATARPTRQPAWVTSA